MKIIMYGPWDAKFEFENSSSGGFVTINLPGRELRADTVAEAIAVYAETCGVSIRPYDGSISEVPFDPNWPFQFFFFTDEKHGEVLTGLGVTRGSEYLKPTDELAFQLEDGDIVSISPVGS